MILEPRLLEQILDRAANLDELRRFEIQGNACGWCREPVRLVGYVDEVETTTGRRGRRFSTVGEPDGVLLKACGSRRVTRCPSCAEVYKQDARQLIAAGLQGGKGVPESVAGHTAVFVTLTAPGFGAVHGCRRGDRRQPCRPGSAKQRCIHGRPTGCWSRHSPNAPELGEPLCAECYDYRTAVLWNATVGELWRRTTIYLRRILARLLAITPRELDHCMRVSYAKVVEYQRRGVVHVHAVVRLDGPDGPSGVPVVDVDSGTLALAIRLAIGQVGAPFPEGLGTARWGEQLDIRVIAEAKEGLRSPAVANYIAKYACKSADEGGVLDRRFRSDVDLENRPLLDHHRRLVRTAWDLGGRPEHRDLHLRYWAHDLGYRGHWLTKSRRWSTTLGALRRARCEWREEQRRAHQRDSGQPVGPQPLLEGSWQFVGTGWSTPGDAYLADQARRSRDEARRLARELRHLELEAERLVEIEGTSQRRGS